MRYQHAVKAGGQFAQEFEMLHHEVGPHDRGPRMDAERRDRAVHRDGLDEVAEGAGAERQRVSARKNHFPYIAVGVEPVAHLFGHVGNILEGVVLAEAETAAYTAGGGRDYQGAPVVLLDDAVGFSGGKVADRVVHESFHFLEFVLGRQDFAQERHRVVCLLDKVCVMPRTEERELGIRIEVVLDGLCDGFGQITSQMLQKVGDLRENGIGAFHYIAKFRIKINKRIIWVL